jgi:uncharacterized membrane protein
MEKLKEILLKFFKLDSIVDHISGYIETRVALVKMEIREEVATALSRVLIILIMFLTGILFLLFISIGLAEYLNQVIGGDYAGFMIVAGFYGSLLLLMIAFRKSLLKAFEKKFVGLIRQKAE